MEEVWNYLEVTTYKVAQVFDDKKESNDTNEKVCFDAEFEKKTKQR